MKSDVIKVFIVDDHQIIVDGIRQFVMSCDDMQFVGSATNGDDAVEQITKLKPDVVVTDLKVPGKNGLEITHQAIRATGCKVIILSMYAEARYIHDARKYGATGYLLKNADREALISAIRKVHGGQTIFHQLPEVTRSSAVLFTPREKDILQMLIDGKQTSEISEALHLSPFTVSTHRKNIMRKTEAGNVAGLIRFVNEHQVFPENTL